MKVQKFSLSDAELVKSPGQDADIFVGNLVDERHGGPVPSDTAATALASP